MSINCWERPCHRLVAMHIVPPGKSARVIRHPLMLVGHKYGVFQDSPFDRGVEEDSSPLLLVVFTLEVGGSVSRRSH